MSSIKTFMNFDGEVVHAVFSPIARPEDGRIINRHYGTYASLSEAQWRVSDIASGKADTRWEEPE